MHAPFAHPVRCAECVCLSLCSTCHDFNLKAMMMEQDDVMFSPFPNHFSVKPWPE